ncbi:putative lipid-binding transport protein (Tim44 family) [Azospirillum rugosum]|uniref:Lipid-binding transport protein (Tim44 family) n=1 Tax=Azospirillum rugosum TaxID=416170 RepID=A0ABS4SMS7_9PROT|nr:putative lipid-binding transport protein (Tim44 family) [Azospirillum rugosum]MDQ0526948.1 putative lipid-binding transport protein (Tim44 family) [Azospirillum rugosum]
MFVEILIFAMIAAFLVYRLRSVLGRRTGEERQRPNPFTARPDAPRAGAPDNVVPMPGRDRPAPAAAAASPDEPVSLHAALAQIAAADSSFDEKHFLQGARGAFQMIVEAFAKGDTATLRPLLADDVYDNFARAVRDRQAAGETLETRIERIADADVVEARMDGRTALVTVKFVSEQMNVVRDRNGAVVDGDPNAVVEAVDVWTFARNTRASNPNWALVETRTTH